jgi:trigger factor
MAQCHPYLDGFDMADDLEKTAVTTDVQIEEVSQCKRRLKFTIPFEAVEQQFNATYQELKDTARIPGFRPGKAPRAIVEMRLGGAFREKALSEVRLQSLGKAVQEHNLRPVSSPLFENISYQKGQPFTFEATVEVLPEISLPEYKGIRINKKEPSPTTDEDVTAEVDRLRENFAQFVLVEDRPLRKGDFAVVNYEEEADGKTEKFEQRVIELTEEAPLPGFVEKVEGMKAGEKREFQIQIPDDYQDKEAAGKLVDYRLELKEFRTKVLPEANDQLAEKVGYKTLDDLRKGIHRRLVEIREREAEQDEVSQIMSSLLKNADFDLPESLVTQGTRARAGRRINAGLRAGMSSEYLKEKREEIIKDAAAETFANLKLQVILSKIAETEGIRVSDDEVNARIESLAAAANANKEEWKKRYHEEERFEDLRYDLLEQKVVSFLHNTAVKE